MFLQISVMSDNETMGEMGGEEFLAVFLHNLIG